MCCGKKLITVEQFEKLAALEHERWSGWHIYMREHMNDENLERWDRLAITHYEELAEGEKDSDRAEVKKMFDVLGIGGIV